MRILPAIAFVAFILGPVSGPVVAETYPTRPIRVVVPFAAAGVQDVVTRIVFEKVSSLLGQAVIVENRPGAGGTIAMAYVAAARPDGYTLVVSDPRGSLPAAPSLYPNLSYNPITSFEPIAMIGSSGAVLSVGKDFPARSLERTRGDGTRQAGRFNVRFDRKRYAGAPERRTIQASGQH